MTHDTPRCCTAGIMIAYGSGQPQHRRVVRNTWVVVSEAEGHAAHSFTHETVTPQTHRHTGCMSKQLYDWSVRVTRVVSPFWLIVLHHIRRRRNFELFE